MDLSYIRSLGNFDHYIQQDKCSNEGFQLYCTCQMYRYLHSHMDWENMEISHRDHQSNRLSIYMKKYLWQGSARNDRRLIIEPFFILFLLWELSE